MGRKKIQITRIMDERNRQVSPWGRGGWMSMRVGKRSVGEGEKEKKTQPATQCSEGPLGIWALCGLVTRGV